MKILFAVDGSRCSEEAIASVVKMKCPMGTEFMVVTAVDFYAAFSADVDARGKEIHAANQFIEETLQKLKAAHPSVSVEGRVLDGHIVQEILRVAEEWPADLIMLGSHGRSGLTEFFLGSVSRSVLSNADCAVRIVRPGDAEKSASKAGSKEGMNVLIGLDQSEHCKHLIDHVLRLPWSVGTKFRLVNVIPEVNKNVLFDPDVEFAKTAATEYDSLIDSHSHWMKETADRLNDTFEQKDIAEFEVLLGDPRKVILEIARSWPADIVMLGSHGKRGMERLFLGSVSEAVATHAPCTVEVTRVPAFRKAKVTA